MNTNKPCPPATQDVLLNLRNRRKAIEGANYGPADPRQANVTYWRERAKEWGIAPAEARKMRCGNCAAFGISPHELACIDQGLASSGVDAYDSISVAELGYCRAFKFKCAASRTCSAWIVGGPSRKS